MRSSVRLAYGGIGHRQIYESVSADVFGHWAAHKITRGVGYWRWHVTHAPSGRAVESSVCLTADEARDAARRLDRFLPRLPGWRDHIRDPDNHRWPPEILWLIDAALGEAHDGDVPWLP